MAAGRTGQRLWTTNPRRQVMAIRTVWPVEHHCGHGEELDVSGIRPSERAGYARWLSGKGCSNFTGARGTTTASTTRPGWPGRRVSGPPRLGALSALSELDGSNESLPWGARVRY